jgi:hypothetical protein
MLINKKNKKIVGTVLIFFLPLIAYLTPHNLSQFYNSDIKVLIFTQLLLFILVLCLSFLIKRFFKINILDTLLIGSTFYYLQFYYQPIIDLFFNDKIIYFFLFELIVILIIYFITKYKNFIFNYAIVYSLILIFYYSINIINFKINQSNQYLNLNKSSSNLNVNIDNSALKNINLKNIYYFIFDGMLPIEAALDLNLIEKNTELKHKEMLDAANFKYIKNSFSNYSLSEHSIASIFYMNYPVDEKNLPYYLNMNDFFPKMLHTAKTGQLFKYLKNSNYSFFWGGNIQKPCKSQNAYVNCLNNNLTEKYYNILLKFYLHTPLFKLVYRFHLTPKVSRAPSDKFMNDVNLDKYGFNNFYFIHNYFPHEPYVFNDDCSKNAEFSPENDSKKIKDGYKKNYNCALQKISSILNVLNKIDPSAIVIVHGDHGWSKDVGNNLSEDQKITYRSKIYNIIKAPDECFQSFGSTPITPINTIRFVINCSLGTKLKKIEDKHFASFNVKSKNNSKFVDKTDLAK